MSEFTVRRGDAVLVWEYIGEGLSGDYDPDDRGDMPLLRATLEMGDMELSYCTLAHKDAAIDRLQKISDDLLDCIDRRPQAARREMEMWTWRTAADAAKES